MLSKISYYNAFRTTTSTTYILSNNQINNNEILHYSLIKICYLSIKIISSRFFILDCHLNYLNLNLAIQNLQKSLLSNFKKLILTNKEKINKLMIQIS